MEETPKPPRKVRSDKGVKKGHRPALTFLPAPEPEPPIWVRIALKNGWTSEFGCAEHTVENGFQVFLYPSERDRYRTTRREFAISEIVEIEITAARHNMAAESLPVPVQYQYEAPGIDIRTPPASGPKIHSVRQHAAGVLAALEQSNGPIKMDTPPGISFGGHDG